MVHCCCKTSVGGGRSWQRAAHTHGRSRSLNWCCARSQCSQIKTYLQAFMIYGRLFRQTFPSYEYIKTDVSVGGRGKKYHLNPLLGEKKSGWNEDIPEEERKPTDTLKRNNPCTNSSASVSQSVG